jgi:hypothetical protein
MKFSLGKRPIARVAVVSVSIVLLVAGCSIYREANRPKPVILSKFEPGQTRDSVVEQLGQPIITEPQPNKDSCDLYELYLTGHGKLRKAATIFFEGAADVVMPASELIWSPAQAATRDKQQPVWFCYQGQKLASVGAKPSPTTTQTPERTSGSSAASTAASSPAAGTAAPVATPAPASATKS